MRAVRYLDEARAELLHLGRDYKNVHGNVAALEEWMAVQRLPDGRVHVPWREIVLDMRLPERLEAYARSDHPGSTGQFVTNSRARAPTRPPA